MARYFLILLVRPRKRALLHGAGGFALMHAGTAMERFETAALVRSFGIVAANPGRPRSGEVSLWR